MGTDREGPLLAWQWARYPDGHTTRQNLMLHVLTVPWFLGGTVALLAAPLLGGYFALGGALGMAAAIAAQGRGHGGEPVLPVPFSGPGDAVARIFCEQWLTFPRFVLSGGLARAWRTSR